MEYYKDVYQYSDELRTGFSIPFDIKIAFNFYFPKSKIKFEAYAACENVFALLYSPKGTVQINQYTGKERQNVSQATSFPIPSIGIKMDF